MDTCPCKLFDFPGVLVRWSSVKISKIWDFSSFFSIRSAADAAAVRKGEERGEKHKLCSGTVRMWQFFTWPSFFIFSSLLQPYEGSLIKVYKMTWEYFHDKSLLSFHKHHQSLFVAEIWLTRLKDKWPDWKRNFCRQWWGCKSGNWQKARLARI